MNSIGTIGKTEKKKIKNKKYVIREKSAGNTFEKFTN